MGNPIDIYSEIIKKIKSIDININVKDNVNKEIVNNLNKSSEDVKSILIKLQTEIAELENQSEWEHYTISFIGETNAGKSTIIEALRIKYNEEEKSNDYDRNFTLLEEEKNLHEKLKQEENQFILEKEKIDKNKKSELNSCFQKAEKFKKTFLFRMRRLLQKEYEPYISKISNLENEILLNSNRIFQDLNSVYVIKKAIDEIRFQLKYDGEIIGDGRLDFTQKNKSFFIKINNELVKIIDVPGIEGNEQKYEDEIKKAVSESHCVFYVTSSSKTLESGTLEKVKKYIKDQADVFAIVNLRLNQYKSEFYDLSFENIFKNKIESISSISNQLKEELKDNFIDVIAINGHWGFLSLSKYINKEKLLNDKYKLENILKHQSVIFEKSNFQTLENVILDTVKQKEDKIYRTNVLKIKTLVNSLIDGLRLNSNRYLNESFLIDIKDQAVNSKKELLSIQKDFSTDLDNIRAKLLNGFKNNSFKNISNFIEKTDINGDKYKVGIEQIISIQTSLLKINIGSNLKEANEKLNKKIEKSLSKFLDRLDTLSKVNNISLNKTKLDVDFNFVFDDLTKITGILWSIGSMAMTGFAVGSFFPVVGNVLGAVVGAIVGAIFEFVKNIFLSTTSKKTKILSKISDQLNIQIKNIDGELKSAFYNISKDVEKNAINEGITLVDELVEMYQLRKNKLVEVIEELESIKI